MVLTDKTRRPDASVETSGRLLLSHLSKVCVNLLVGICLQVSFCPLIYGLLLTLPQLENLR